MKFEFSAGGIIYKKEKKGFKFALVQDGYHKWTFPKGKIEKGEKPEETAIREVGEEIGIKDLEIITLLEKIDYWFKDKTALIHKFVYFYLMEAAKNSVLKLQIEELEKAQWFDAPSARKTLDYKKENLRLLEKALEVLNRPKK